MSSQYDLIILAACFNRKNKTKAFLKSVSKQCRELEKSFRILIVDNNSTDGTAECIREIDPEVEVLNTPKDMYWAQSMVFGFDWIINKQVDFKLLLAANDDISLNDRAIEVLLRDSDKIKSERPNFALVGAFCDSEDGRYTYGGQRPRFSYMRSVLESVPVSGDLSVCESFNMNLVILPKLVMETYGFLDRNFVHGLADFDFGLRLSSKGVTILQTAEYIGVCNRNPNRNGPHDPQLSLKKRYSAVFSSKGNPIGPTLRYTWRHSGILSVVHLLYIYLSPALVVLKRLSNR